MIRRASSLLLFLAVIATLPAWARQEPRSSPSPDPPKSAEPSASERVIKTDREWQRILTREQYLVLRRRATEPAFTGRYATGHHRGIFVCAGCGAELFSSNHKFNSGTGWPSFFRPLRESALERAWDYSGYEPRIEVACARCGGHLGHVFSDGPPPTGLRFCINSAALKLKPFPRPTPRKTKPSQEKPSEATSKEADPALSAATENPPPS